MDATIREIERALALGADPALVARYRAALERAGVPALAVSRALWRVTYGARAAERAAQARRAREARRAARGL